MKLIALQQIYVELTEYNLNLYTSLPVLEGISIKVSSTDDVKKRVTIFKDEQDNFGDHFVMNDKSLKRIEFYIDNKCRTKVKGILDKSEAQELFN